MKLKLKVNIVVSTRVCSARKLQNRTRACIQCEKRESVDNGERRIRKIRHSARGSTWIAFTSVNCGEIKQKSVRPYETWNNYVGCFFISPLCGALDCMISVKLQRNAETCRCVTFLKCKHFFWPNRHNLTRHTTISAIITSSVRIRENK